MRLKDETGKGDFTNAFSPVPHASGLRILLAIATEMTCSLITKSLKPLRKANCNRAMDTLAFYTFPLLLVAVLGSKP
jgi:hypothetical protein